MGSNIISQNSNSFNTNFRQSSKNMSELLYSLPASWDLHNLGALFNPDFPPGNYEAMEESPQQIFRSPSVEYSDVSTGYLEDALIEFSDRSKRRRLLFYADDQPKGFDDLSQNNWGLSEDFSRMSQFAAGTSSSDLLYCGGADEEKSRISNSGEAISASFESPNSSSSSHKISVQEKSPIYPKISAEPSSSCSENDDVKRKTRVVTRIVYPFALVKPGGREDDVTLNDINERILMPPTRPVRHPVGDFACRPCVTADGTGLSGKAVVALTRIQTQGRGTITIIRTKG